LTSPQERIAARVQRVDDRDIWRGKVENSAQACLGQEKGRADTSDTSRKLGRHAPDPMA
jgi:hypothetical protein